MSEPSQAPHLSVSVPCFFSLLTVPLLEVIHKITWLVLSFPNTKSPNTCRLQMSEGLMDPLNPQAAGPVAEGTNRSIGVILLPMCAIQMLPSSV